MNIFGVLTMAGGLALFLYGMNVMGDSLAKLSGGKLEQILEKLTSKRIMAVLLGMAVTAVIQSSSATTVMVVGFVNSGIMQLSQAVGIIMGANIGTTVTSWMLSLTGISGAGWINLLKPSSFSPVLAVIGIIMTMTCKDNSKKKDIGNILLGFAILMFGMETMSGAVAPLADNEKFTGMLTLFSNPLFGLLAGTVLTAVIQSSSASVGILQALCVTGAVNYATAIPIIMGQNIGTCVTALISSVGAKKNAKRASMIHLYFNMIGTVIFMVIFYSLNMFVHFEFLSTPANAAGIAVIHSLFNIGCVIILFPFSNLLVKLATLSIPDGKHEEVIQTGVAADLATAPDEAFAQKMMGDGAVVTPEDPYVRAPEDGEVAFVFDTRHAIGFVTESGISLLIHVGIDTVKLNGEGFEALVESGQEVKKGDPMLKLDLEYLKTHAPSVTSPVLCTELEENQRIRLLADGPVKAGDPLFAIEILA